MTSSTTKESSPQLVDPRPPLTLVRPGGLGDSLLLAPALSVIRNSENSITLVGYPDRLNPMSEAGLVDRVLHLEDWLPNPTPGRIVSFIDLPIGVCDDAAIHPAFPEKGSSVHVAEHIAGCLGTTLPSLDVSPLRGLATEKISTRPVLWIHPGSGDPAKRWPCESFLRVAETWRTRFDGDVRFLLGEAELDLTDPLTESGHETILPERLVDLTRGWCAEDWFLGNDSGVAHLAGLCGLRTFTIFGPTDPILWRPCGERVRVLRIKNAKGWPTADEIDEAMSREFMEQERTLAQ